MKSSPRAGFSLLHMILLLAGLTTLASLAIPAWFSRSSVTLSNATRLFARDLLDAQDRAAYQHRDIRVVFDPDGGGYAVVGPKGDPIEAPVGEGEFVRRYAKDAVFRGVHIEGVQVGPDRAVHFGPRGNALQAGSIVLTFRGEERHIEIEPITGDLQVDGTSYRAR